jgi:hypothetical protein
MRRLLAVGVIGSWEGEWQKAQGNELSVAAAPISEGEQVYLQVERADSPIEAFPLSDIPVLLQMERGSRYRVVKYGNGVDAPLATTVEVILSNGSLDT